MTSLPERGFARVTGDTELRERSLAHEFAQLGDREFTYGYIVGACVPTFPGRGRQKAIDGFAGCAAYGGASTFLVGRDSLADRLSITPQGAGGLVGHLLDFAAIILIKPYAPHKEPALYSWFCPAKPRRDQCLI